MRLSISTCGMAVSRLRTSPSARTSASWVSLTMRTLVRSSVETVPRSVSTSLIRPATSLARAKLTGMIRTLSGMSGLRASAALAAASCSLAMSSSLATRMMFPISSLPSPLERSTRSRAWSQGTLRSETVTLPETSSATTMFFLETSAMSRSRLRISMSWNSRLMRRPVYPFFWGAPEAA